MTFDELWRRDLDSRQDRTCSTDMRSEGGILNVSASLPTAFDDLDKTEMNRFLEWLETSLLPDDRNPIK